MKKFLILLLSLPLSAGIFAQNETRSIDSLFLKSVDNAEFSGSVLVAKRGAIILTKGYGYSHEEQKIPNDVNTVFNIASLTKTFTAALILKLQEQRKLSVSDRGKV